MVHKLKTARITAEIQNWFESYLSDRKQRNIFLAFSSDWIFVRAGVPPRSGPMVLLFLKLTLLMIMFQIFASAEDTSLLIVVD